MFGLIIPDSSYAVPVGGNAGGKLAFHPHLSIDRNTRRTSAKADNVLELPANVARGDPTSSHLRAVALCNSDYFLFPMPSNGSGFGVDVILQTNQPMSSTTYVRANNGLSADLPEVGPKTQVGYYLTWRCLLRPTYYQFTLYGGPA